MDKNVFSKINVAQERLRWSVNTSNSWTKQRQASTVKSRQSSLSGFQVNGRPKCLTDPISRSFKNAVGSSALEARPPVGEKNVSFCRPAGVSTIDQSWRQGKTPWIGNTFLSKSSKEKKGCLTAPRKFLSSRTLKIKSFDGSVGTINDSELPDIDLTSSILSTLQPSQHSSYSCSQNLNEEQNRKSRKKVVLLTDHSLKRMRETSNIYLEKNSAFHKQRMRNIESNIGNKHRTQLDRQMTEVEQIEHERHEKSIKNMKELANVRNRFLKEKQKRVRNTYVSVAALEMPEVDRYAYGLPADGKEYKFTKKKNVKNKASIEGRWQDSMQKARSIVKVLALREKVARTMTLPILKPLTSHKNRKKDVNRPDDTVLEDSVDTKLDIDQSIMDRASVKSDDFSREKSINAIKAFIDLTSEISSLHDTATDLDTDLEDF